MTDSLTQKLAILGLELEPTEEAFRVIHKHWGRILLPLSGLAILILLTLVAAPYALASGGLGNQLTALLIVILGIFYLTVVSYGLSEWYSYTHSAFIITNQRLIDCQQVNIWSRRVQTIDIYEVQGCSGELMPGWGVVLNFGQLMISVVGDLAMRVGYVPQPEAVSADVMRYHNVVSHQAPINPIISEFTAAETKDSTKDSLVMFHVPSEQLKGMLADLPARKEPSVRYLAKTDYYEVETMVPTSRLEAIVPLLRAGGAEDIVCQPLQSFD